MQYLSVVNQETLILTGQQLIELKDEEIPTKFEYSNKFSITCWIKTKTLQVSAILAKMANEPPFRGWNILLNDTNTPGSLRLQIIHSFPQSWIEVGVNARDIIDDRWHHITIVYNGINKANQVQFFIDGKERLVSITSDCLTNSIMNSLPITVGARSKGGCEFHGCINDLRIYDFNLSISEIEEIYTSSKLYKKISLKPESIPNVLILKNVQKIFRLHHNAPTTIYERLTKILKKNEHIENLLILDNINLEIKQGEMIGIIGRNGSGKTTLLKIMAGIVEPTKGKVIVKGTIAPFLSLGSGFNPELDAEENIIMYGMLLGIPKQKIRSQIDKILKFAELEHYRDVKLKTFSSGMFMRLAFSVAVSLDPDILLIDEVLAVGDTSFQQKSFQKLLSFKEDGKSIILVTHSLEQIENLCDRAVYLHGGHVIAIGPPKEVVEIYKNSLR